MVKFSVPIRAPALDDADVRGFVGSRNELSGSWIERSRLPTAAATPASEAVYSYPHLKENYSDRVDQKGRNHSRLASAISYSGSSARIRAFARRTSQRTERGSGRRVAPDIVTE